MSVLDMLCSDLTLIIHRYVHRSYYTCVQSQYREKYLTLDGCGVGCCWSDLHQYFVTKRTSPIVWWQAINWRALDLCTKERNYCGRPIYKLDKLIRYIQTGAKVPRNY